MIAVDFRCSLDYSLLLPVSLALGSTRLHDIRRTLPTFTFRPSASARPTFLVRKVATARRPRCAGRLGPPRQRSASSELHVMACATVTECGGRCHQSVVQSGMRLLPWPLPPEEISRLRQCGFTGVMRHRSDQILTHSQSHWTSHLMVIGLGDGRRSTEWSGRGRGHCAALSTAADQYDLGYDRQYSTDDGLRSQTSAVCSIAVVLEGVSQLGSEAVKRQAGSRLAASCLLLGVDEPSKVFLPDRVVTRIEVALPVGRVLRVVWVLVVVGRVKVVLELWHEGRLELLGLELVPIE